MKKTYFAPEMEIVEIKNQPSLLAGSFKQDLDPDGGDGGNALAPEYEWADWEF